MLKVITDLPDHAVKAPGLPSFSIALLPAGYSYVTSAIWQDVTPRAMLHPQKSMEIAYNIEMHPMTCNLIA